MPLRPWNRTGRPRRRTLPLRGSSPQLVQVKLARLADELLRRRLGQSPGRACSVMPARIFMSVGDGEDAECAREFRLGLGVDLAEHRVCMPLRRMLEDRPEHPARSALGRPSTGLMLSRAMLRSAGQAVEVRAMQTEASGGSRETETKELFTIPAGAPSTTAASVAAPVG